MKSMNMYGIYLLRRNKMGYILYPKKIKASHICPPKRNKLFKQRNGNRGFRENIDCDMQHACQNHMRYESCFHIFAFSNLTVSLGSQK